MLRVLHPEIVRTVIFVGVGVLLPLLFTQCRTVASYKDVEYDPATLRTPDGHGMEKKEYPFDDAGNYRKEWVKNNSGGRTRSSYDLPDPTEPGSVSATDGAVLASATTTTGTSTIPANGYVGPADGSSAPAIASTASVSTEYHRVVTGDTLFSLAQRYGTSVDELKRVNGLTGDAILAGQSLRVP